MLYFDKEFAKGLNGVNHKAQYDHVTAIRNGFNVNQKHIKAMYGNAAAIIPQDVYREFENQTKVIMRAPNLTLMQDLMPLAKTLPVGKLEHVVRKASDSGIVTSSLGGQVTNQLDKADYDYDSSIKVIHQTGYGREWMEMEGQRSEGFDGLIDDNANAVRAIADKVASHIYDGADVSFKGVSAYGIKTSSKVQAVDLGASGLNIDFSTSTDTSAIRSAFIDVRDNLRITNNAMGDITFYVSREIASNFQNFFSTADTGFGTIKDALLRIDGVADIKEDASLSGNEMVGMILDSQFIRPLVGMATSTVPIQRTDPMANYNFLVWTQVGLEIRTDYAGRTGVMYAREIT